MTKSLKLAGELIDAACQLVGFLCQIAASLAGLVGLILVVHFFALWAHPFAG